MTLHSFRYFVAFILILTAGLLLFLWNSSGFDSLRDVSPVYFILMAVAGLAVFPFKTADRQARSVFYGSGLLVLISAGFLLVSSRDHIALEKEWRVTDSRRIQSSLITVGEKIHRLANLLDEIGGETRQFLLSRPAYEESDSLTFRLEAFRVLKRQAENLAESGLLPGGTEIGIQLLDQDQRRIAWAGWPQPLSLTDLALVQQAEEVLYTRRISLYRILTRIIPIKNKKDGLRGWVVIDTPLEVNYRVQSRYLKSTSLAETMAAGLPVNIRLDYRPAYPSGFDRIQIPADAPPDSLPERSNLPGYLTMLSTGGDQTLGLSARARVDDRRGEPILYVTVHGRPFRYFADNYAQRYRLMARICLSIVLVMFFVFSTRRYPRRLAGPLESIRFCYLIGMFVLLRFALLAFQPAPSAEGLRIFDPAIFATPVLKGMMRSAGDLLLTALLLVVALYVILKMARTRLDQREKQPAGPRGFSILKGLFTAAMLVSIIELLHKFISTVVVNANPRLLGDTMKPFAPEVLVLHLSIFLMVTGVVLAGLLSIWGIMRVKGAHRPGRVGLIALLCALPALVMGWHWTYAVLGVLLILFIVFAPRFTRREDLVSIVIVSFAFVLIASGAAYTFLNEEYQNLRKSFIQEKAGELAQPLDNWKVFILEDIMEGFVNNPEIKQTLRRPDPVLTRQLAFDLWAGSPLSLLGYSTGVYVLSTSDSIMARFSVDMPFRMKPADETERTDTERSEEWVVLDLTKRTPQGDVRFYRGIVNIEDAIGREEGGVEYQLLGKIIVDLPFSFENLAWAARTGPRTPELLRNIQEGSIEPRLEEPEALLLAHIRGTRIVESSSEELPVGLRLPPEHLVRASELRWPVLNTPEGTYRYLIEESGQRDKLLLAGFKVPSPLWHVLHWSTIFSLYLFFTVSFLVVIVLLRQIPRLGALLPTLTPGRQLGFQQKLLGSFLIVALLPAIIIGVFSVRVIQDRFVDENKEEALYKAFSARASLVNMLTDERDAFLFRTDLDALFAGGLDPQAAAGNRLLLLLDATGRQLDRDEFDDAGAEPAVNSSAASETAKDKPRPDEAVAGGGEPGEAVTSGEEPGETATGDGGTVEMAAGDERSGDAAAVELSQDDVWITEENGVPYIGVMSRPIMMPESAGGQTVYVYYARRLDGVLLGEIADQVGADVNIYDRGRLVASSREGLLTGGFIRPVMSSDAYMKVSLMGVDQSISTERTGEYGYQVAYLPLPSSDLTENAALSLPLLFRSEPYHVEVQKATSIVLGIFALLFAATIGLGLLLARGIFEPLKNLLEGTKRISRGDLSFKLPAARSDEIGTLVDAFNEMTTQLDQSQQVLEQRRRYLEVILTNIGTGVVSTDEKDRIITVNDAAQRILGLAPGQAVGRKPGELAAGGVAPEIFSLLEKRKEAGANFISSEVDMVLGGTKRTIKYMLTKLTSEQHYLGTVFVFEDLTELISSKKLSAWVEMARQIAHEIKNPLTPIKLSTQFMQRAHAAEAPDFDKIFNESTETIIHQVDVLKRIAGEFSSFGKMQQLDIKSIPIMPLVNEIVTPYRSNTTGVEITVEFECDGVNVSADSEAVRKICANLIENAMEAMTEGGRLIIGCRRLERDGGEYVKVLFRDSGPGLSDEVVGKLFEPYFSTKTTGTGLGLAICRTLSREMGGEVTVENVAAGEGVEAAVYLKVVQSKTSEKGD